MHHHASSCIIKQHQATSSVIKHYYAYCFAAIFIKAFTLSSTCYDEEKVFHFHLLQEKEAVRLLKSDR